jgi:tetratricopeptide (TPR) repeat protein/predicted Ser/Thr protein kinase
MTSESRRARWLFEEALELPPERRAAFLDERCGDDVALRREVESLLDAERDMGSFLGEGRLGALAAETLEGAPDPLLGRPFGRYRIISLIARGGMGVVYKAVQDNPSREVALKLIPRGVLSPEAVRRFEVEVEVLARLQHPAIARIFDAGTAETEHGTWPFFAMEYIEGLPLTEWAHRKGLNLRQRLALMVKVCEGVQHAHQKGVIHRDLKPANILVDESGQPRILDFGVARSTDADIRRTTMESASSGLMGTLPYMSPEQVRGVTADLDTRSDVYALGVLCFEILSGGLPHDLEGRSIAESIRIIAEARPSTLAAAKCRLPDDVETIVGKALAGDPDRRYDSAASLAADIQRFLDDRPILARPPSVLYLVRKLLARNRLASALTGALVILAVAASVLVAMQTQRIRQERDRATAQAATAREVSDFLQNLFSVSDPRVARGREMSARELLDRGAERIGSDLESQPLVQARLLILLGNIYRNLGYLDEARPLLEQGVELSREFTVESPELLPEGLQGLAWLDRNAGRFKDGAAAAAEAVEAAEAALGSASPLLAELTMVRGVLLRDMDELEQARDALERAVAMAEETSGAGSRELGTALYHLAWLDHKQGRDQEALALQERACPILEQALGEDRTEVAWCYNDQALVLRALGRRDDSADRLRQALSIWERVLPPGHPDVAAGIDNLASQLLFSGKIEEARTEYERALGMRRESLGAEHPDVGSSLCNLGYSERELGRYPASEQHFLEGLAILETALGPDDNRGVACMNSLGELYLMWERPGDALAVYEKTVAARARSHGTDHPWYAGALKNRAQALSALGHHRQAESDYRRAYEIAASRTPPGNPTRNRIAIDLADCLLAQGRAGEAQPILEEVRRNLKAAGAEGNPLARAWFSLARAARIQSDADGAAAALSAALELRRNSLPPDDELLLYTEAVARADAGDSEKALDLLRRALAAGFSSNSLAPDLDFPGLAGTPGFEAVMAEFAPEAS